MAPTTGTPRSPSHQDIIPWLRDCVSFFCGYDCFIALLFFFCGWEEGGLGVGGIGWGIGMAMSFGVWVLETCSGEALVSILRTLNDAGISVSL